MKTRISKWLLVAGVAVGWSGGQELRAVVADTSARFHDWQDAGCSQNHAGVGGAASGQSGAGSNQARCTACTGTTSRGMPRWWVSEPYENLCLSDTPLSYTTSSGQEMAFTFYYRQRYQLPGTDEVPGSLLGAIPRWVYPNYYVPAIPYGMTNAVWGNNWMMNILFWDSEWENAGSYYQNGHPVYSDRCEAYVFRPEGEIEYFYNFGGGNASLQDARSQVQLQSLAALSYPALGDGQSPDANGFYWGSATNGFRLAYPDGSQDVFGLTYYLSQNLYSYFYQPDPGNTAAEALLTARIDPQGRVTRLGYEYFINYDLWGEPKTFGFRLRYVVDPDGRTNTFLYVTSPNPPNPWALTEVDDPYGRKAQFGSDSNSGVLTSITDAAGLSSSFEYLGNGSGWITNLTTPYGSTGFSFYQVADPAATNGFEQRAVYVSEPEGAQQLFLFEHTNGLVSATGTAPADILGQSFDDGTSGSSHYTLNYRNTFHWGRRQFAALSSGVQSALPGNWGGALAGLTAADYNKADLKHWLVLGADQVSITESLSSEQDPSPDAAGQVPGQRTWYNYPDKPSPESLGDNPQASCVARLLPDGSSQYTTYNFYPPGYPGAGLVWDNESSYSLPDGAAGVLTNWFHYAGNSIDLASVSNSVGQFWKFGYNTNHQATFATNALGQITGLSWDNSTRGLTQISLPSGLSASLTYYASNALSANGGMLQTLAWSPTGRSLTFTWTNGLPRSVQDDRGLDLTNSWDGLNRLTATAFPDGTTASNLYDRLYLGAAKDRLGNWTGYGYDSLEHLATITDPLGNVTTLGWCDCGALSSITDALTNTTSLFYNNQGLLTNIAFPDSSSLSYTLDSLGRVTRAFDGLSRALSYGYNNQGLLTTVSNAYGLVERVIYDAANRPVQVTDASGVTVTNQFDLLDRLTARFWPDGIGEGFGWAANGLVAYTNRDQKVTRYARDGAGRLTGLTNANQEITVLGYNSLDQVTDLWDGRANHTGWGYNEYGWLTNKVDALGHEVLRLTHDPNGQTTNRWTPQFGNTAYALDAAGNLITTSYAQSGASISFAYDALNRLRTMVDAVGTATFGYTAAGQLQSAAGPWSDDTLTYGYTQEQRTSLALSSLNFYYGYDSAWRLSTLSSPAGSFGYGYDAQRPTLPTTLTLPNTAWTTNHYDSLARLDYTALVNRWGHVLDGYGYTHDPLGLRTSITRNLGLTNSSVTAGYDSIGQLSTWQAREGSSGPARLNEQLGWVYDAAGNLRYRTNGGLVQTFTMDPVNQLTNVARNNTMTVSGATPVPASSLTVNGESAQTYGDFTFAATNQSLVDGENTFTIIAENAYGVKVTNSLSLNLAQSTTLRFDLNGNLTNDGTRSFAYDAENRLVTNWVASAWKAEFVYDGLGRRRIERDYGWQSGWVKTNETRYVYDGYLAIQERDGNNAPLVTYTRGLDLSASLQGAGGIGGLVARTDGNGSTFYHADGAGNVTALMDGQQNMAARYMYSAFGRLTGKWGPMADANAMQFSSMPRHANSGLSLYHMRAYDTGLQRWLSRDPAGERGGINLYGFVRNNPLRYADPWGLGLILTDEAATGPPDSALTTEQLANATEYDLFGPPTYVDMSAGPNPLASGAAGSISFASGGGFSLGESPSPVLVPSLKDMAGDLAVMLALGVITDEALAPFLPELEELLAAKRLSKCAAESGATKLLTAGTDVPNAGGVIRSFAQEGDQIYYRVFSGSQQGRFLTAVPPSSSAFAREALALPPGNQASFIQEVLIPNGTILQRSRALPAFGARGGAEQFELLQKIPNGNFGPGTPLP